MRRGHSLLEVLLVTGLFGFLLVTVSWVYTQTSRAQRRAEPAHEASRAALVGLEKVRAELRDALVLGQPLQAGQVDFRAPLSVTEGGLEWSPDRSLRVSQGFLERVESGQPAQRLAFLGDGRVVFHRPPGNLDVLEVEVEAERSGDKRSVRAVLPLYHQH
ncbi:MAG: type II secretion system protein [Candidatus Eremiobacterota bacterium]